MRESGPPTRPVQADWRPGSEPPKAPAYAYVVIDGKIALGSWDGRNWRHTGVSGDIEWWAPLIFPGSVDPIH